MSGGDPAPAPLKRDDAGVLGDETDDAAAFDGVHRRIVACMAASCDCAAMRARVSSSSLC